MDFAINCLLVRPGRPRYPVLVHRAAALLHASFRRHLTMPPLRFANPSPSSGWIEDFHLQAVDQCSAHNMKAARRRDGRPSGLSLTKPGLRRRATAAAGAVAVAVAPGGPRSLVGCAARP